MSVLRRVWQGKYSLRVAFWGFYIVGLTACLVVSVVIISLSAFLSYGGFLGARPIAFAIAFVLTDLYLPLATVGVWRSAGAYWTSPIWMRRIWAAAARLWVTIWIAKIAFNLADGGALAIVQRIAGDIEF